VNVYIGYLQDSQEGIIFYEEDYDADGSICLSEPSDEPIVLVPFSLLLWAQHDDVYLNAPTDSRELMILENKAQIAGMHATILEVVAEQHGMDYKVPTCHFPIKTAMLVDFGANGEIEESDVYFLKTGEIFADISGIGDHQLSNFPSAGLVQDQHDCAIATIPQVIYHGKGALFSLVVTWELTRSSWIMMDSFKLLGNSGLKQWIDIFMLFPVLMKIGILELFFMTTNTLPHGLKTCPLSLDLHTWICASTAIMTTSISLWHRPDLANFMMMGCP